MNRLASNQAIAESLERRVQSFVAARKICQREVASECKVEVAAVGRNRLGLVAIEPIRKGEVVLAVPFDDRFILSKDTAIQAFGAWLPDNFDCWTGEAGLIALALLREISMSASATTNLNRQSHINEYMRAWLETLPRPSEMDHPYLWSEADQEVLQASSTTKIYGRLDDIEEDAAWFSEHFFKQRRSDFPSQVELGGVTVPCFSEEGFKWAMALVESRSLFLNGSLRLIPFLDMANHDDGAEEVQCGSMGTFGTVKGARLLAATNYNVGDEVYCSYGPKSPAEFLLEDGFIPKKESEAAVAQLKFTLDPNEAFYDDKLDILECETYDQSPMDPVQSFDVVSMAGRDGEPDPAMLQFLRLCKLGGMDAFLLESVFRSDVWGFMELPISEDNEKAALECVFDACETSLKEFASCPEGGRDVCKMLRALETRALRRTIEFIERDKESLDLKEYYQERRLRGLGLDSEWSPEDDMSEDDLAWDQKRKPGGADYDW